jgi:predicted DNA-binding protein
MKRMVKLNVRLPNHIFATLRQKSRVTGLSMSAIVRNSVEKGLSKLGEQPISRMQKTCE